MKKSLLVGCICGAFLSFGDYVFSRDAKTVLGRRANCPVQGVRLSDGKVIVGLDVCDHPTQASCGYWVVANVPPPAPVSNEQYRVSGFRFEHSVGQAYPTYEAFVPPETLTLYSKYSILCELDKLGKWETAKAAMEQRGLTDRWNAITYIESTNATFKAAKPEIARVLGMTEAEIDALLKRCIY